MTEPARDRWGRPLIVPPGGGKPVAYTRATTLAKTLEDEAALANWKMRMVAVGLARRPDLVALASTSDDKKRLDDITQQALDAAASSARANVGTALHAVIERLNRGEDTGQLLDSLAADVDAYRRATAGLAISMPETFVVNDTWQVAGTFDFLVERNNMLLIGDLKTGADLSYSWRSIAVQLATYANAEWVYDPDTHERSPMPPVDKAIAVVVHLPAGEARCVLYTIDIAAGLEAADRSLWCRRWRRTRLAEELVLDDIVQPVAERVDWLRARAKVLIDAGHGDVLAARWPTDVPTFRQGVSSDADLDKIEALLWSVEGKTGQQFPPEQPGPEQPQAPVAETHATHVADKPAPQPTLDEGDTLNDTDRKAMADVLGTLLASTDTELVARLSSVATEAHAAGRSININAYPTRRRWSIARAVWCLATHHRLDDTVTRDLIARATGETTAAPLGDLISALTIDEADRLAETAQSALTPAA